jgi:hypothetical protein
MALVTRSDLGQIQLVWRIIVSVPDVIERMKEANAVRPYELVIVGSGTNSANVVSDIREQCVGLSILLVDEKDTTLQARERYWVNTTRHGWRRFLPSTLQVPPEPIDDFAAFILAERVLTSG